MRFTYRDLGFSLFASLFVGAQTRIVINRIERARARASTVSDFSDEKLAFDISTEREEVN